jgi:16S rRNA (adenine1518-N6/adenine1519-N6)-dimethyltransferase
MEPKKSLGQNFLFDLNIARKIARAAPGMDGAVIEVGPGPGGLTRALLECGAKKVIAIEKDRAAAPILDEIAKAAGGRLEVVYGDALKIDLGHFGKISVCANLPYNIGTELFTKWLRLRNISSMTLMFQREVAERIAARPGEKEYGRLSVLTALAARAKILFSVPNTAFFPPPKVRSAVVGIVPTKAPKNLARIEAVTAALFGRRRKMIRSIMPGVDWGAFGLAGTERAEQLPPEVFLRLADSDLKRAASSPL